MLNYLLHSITSKKIKILKVTISSGWRALLHRASEYSYIVLLLQSYFPL